MGAHPDGRPAEVGAPARPDTTGGAITRRASFRWFTLGLVSQTAGKLAVTVILVAYLTDRGYSLPQAGLAVAAVGGHSATLVGAAALTAIGAYALHRAHRAFTTEAAAG